MNNRECFLLGFDTKMESGSVGEIMIYSRIVSYKWDKDDPEITALEFDAAMKKLKDVERLNIRINSPGGVVDQAIAMRSMLGSHPAKEKHIYIEGMCASAATLLASIPGCTVHIAEGSNYMIHNPYTYAIGDANELDKVVAHLRMRENDCRAMYARRCGKDEATIKAWMDETKWFSAQQAIDEGFADELIEAGEIAACAEITEDAMHLMRALYANMPDGIATPKPEPPIISNAGEVASATPAPEHTQTQREENTDMDMTTITSEQIMKERPDLFKTITEAGTAAERERMQEIDDLTPPGYEQMAAEAKESGETAMDFHKRIVKAQREKGSEFLATRKQETDPAKEIKGGASVDNDGDAMSEADKIAKEIAALAPDRKEI